MSSSFWRSTSWSAILNILNLELHLAGLDRLRVGDIDFLFDGSHLEAEGLVGLGDLGVDADPLLLLLLPRLLFLDLGVAIRAGGGDPGVLERFLDLGLPESVEVALVILDGAEDKGAELETHSLEIRHGPPRGPSPGIGAGLGKAPRPSGYRRCLVGAPPPFP